jgi:hypothetical protein
MGVEAGRAIPLLALANGPAPGMAGLDGFEGKGLDGKGLDVPVGIPVD